jgi:hypothetical protein
MLGGHFFSRANFKNAVRAKFAEHPSLLKL